MQHLSLQTLVERGVRCQICPICHHRPKGSESLGPRDPRSCEPTCAIFRFLPELEEIAATHANEPGAYEEAIRSHICSACTLSPTAGEFCSESLNRTCPLATYGNKVIELLEGLLAIR